MTNQTDNIRKSDGHEKYGLDCIASICYQTKANCDILELAQPFLAAGRLKDLVIHFRQNQMDWMYRILRAMKEFGKLKGIDWYSSMKKDLEGAPLIAMTDIIRSLYQVLDMEGAATLFEEVALVEDLSPILPQLKFIIQNEKYRQQAAKAAANAGGQDSGQPEAAA